MVYRTSFNGLKVEVKGVYSAYNLTSEEIADIQRRFCNQINGSGSNYTIYFSAERHVWINLFVHTLWVPVKFDIRDDILAITKSDRIYEKDIARMSKYLKGKRVEIPVNYDIRSNFYSIANKEDLIELLTEAFNKSKLI